MKFDMQRFGKNGVLEIENLHDVYSSDWGTISFGTTGPYNINYRLKGDPTGYYYEFDDRKTRDNCYHAMLKLLAPYQLMQSRAMSNDTQSYSWG